MSFDYSILLDSKEPIDFVKTQLEQVINSPFKLAEYWELYDLYYVEVMGLRIRISDWRENAKHYDDEYSQFTYKIQVEYVREITGLSDGKEWVRIAIVELARMVSRNLKCKTAVERTDVITHRFNFEEFEA